MKTNLAKSVAGVLARFTKPKPKSVLLYEYSKYSGSNTRKLGDTLKRDYDVRVMDGKLAEQLVHNTMKGFIKKVRLWLYIARFQFVISTHGLEKTTGRQTLIELWHGIPLKAMGSMEVTNEDSVDGRFKMDYLITASKMQSTLMNACHHVDFYKHRVLGSPRNDYLAEPPAGLVERLSGRQGYAKVLLYMPTFRQGYLGRTEGTVEKDLFNFGDLEQERAFLRFLEEQNYLLIVKLHPMEEAIALEKFSKLQSNHVFILKSDLLEQHDLDLYRLLPEVDMLITDYSSIYFDFLLLDRPVVFTNHDLEQYRGKRGLLLEPYDFWTPGFKVQQYSRLQDAVERSFTEDPYAQRRRELRNIFHEHQDGQSAERIAAFIDEIYAKKQEGN